MKDLSLMVDNEEKVMFNFRTALWIERGNKVYIEVKPTIHFTTVPGGRIHMLENTKEGLLREIEEEMHITLDINEIKLKTVIENFFEDQGRRFHEAYYLYKLEVKEDDNRFIDNKENYDSEASYYKWVDKDKLEEVNLLPEVLRHLSNEDKVEHIIQDDLKGWIDHEI